MKEYLFSILAAFVIAFHLFSLKLLSVYDQYFYEILIFIIVTMIISRYLIYLAMSETSNPADVHLLLNTSVFVTLLLSVYFLKLKNFDIIRYITGIVVVIIGLYIVQTSY